MKKVFFILACAVLAFSGESAVYPRTVGTVAPNVWTYNYSGALAEARKTGYPVFLLMGDSVTCHICSAFVNNTINGSFGSVVGNTSEPFYPVLIDRAGNGKNLWSSLWPQFRTGNGEMPSVNVINSDGKRVYHRWPGEGAWRFDYTAEIQAALRGAAKKTTMLGVKDDFVALAALDQAYTGTVVRTGNSGQTGSLKLVLEGEAASNYTIEPETILWDGKDGEWEYVIRRNSPLELPLEKVEVAIASAKFGTSDIAYVDGRQSSVITFHQDCVKAPLDDFAKEFDGVESFEGSGAVWFVDLDGNLASSAIAEGESACVRWSVTEPGIATIVSSLATATISINAGPAAQLGTEDGVTVGVNSGDEVSIEFAAEGGPIASAGLSFAWKPVGVLTISNPIDNEIFDFQEVKADPSSLNLAWTKDFDGEFEKIVVSAKDGASEEIAGTEQECSPVDLGLLSLEGDDAPGDVTFMVEAWTAKPDFGEAVSVSAEKSLTVTRAPIFVEGTPTNLEFCVKSPVDVSVEAIGEGEVTYSAKNLPNGLRIDPSTGVLSGTPTRVATFKTVITASNGLGAKDHEITIRVTAFPETVKGKYVGLIFDEEQAIVGQVASFSVTASGKVTSRFVLGGTKKTIKGTTIALAEGLSMRMNGFNGTESFDLIPSGSVYVGRNAGYLIIVKKVAKSGDYTGVYTASLRASGEGGNGGYLTVKATSALAGSASGRVMGKGKYLTKSTLLVLQEEEIEELLPAWKRACGGNQAFGYVYKKVSSAITICGGYTIAKNDKSLWGRFSGAGRDWESIGGAYDTAGGFEKMSSANLSLPQDLEGNVGTLPLISVTAKSFKVEKKNAYGATLSVRAKTGVFFGKYKVAGKTINFEGVIVQTEESGMFGTGGTWGVISGMNTALPVDIK